MEPRIKEDCPKCNEVWEHHPLDTSAKCPNCGRRELAAAHRAESQNQAIQDCDRLLDAIEDERVAEAAAPGNVIAAREALKAMLEAELVVVMNRWRDAAQDVLQRVGDARLQARQRAGFMEIAIARAAIENELDDLEQHFKIRALLQDGSE